MIRLFVVSDSPVVRAGLRSILESAEGLQVVGEGSLEDLTAEEASLRPDLVLVELATGERDDLETFWRLLDQTPGITVVLLSGDPDEAFAREALQAGVRGYLLRDVSPEELIDGVRAAHQGLTVLHPATAHALLASPQPMAPPSGGESLTARELEVLRLLAQGLPSKTIASRLQISEHTVKFHVGSILGKLGAASRTEAVSTAIRRGLIAL